MATYYFDGSNAATTDPDGVWASESNFTDQGFLSGALCATAGSTSSNFMLAQGTSAILSGNVINSVQARVSAAFDFASEVSATIYTDGLAEALGTAVDGTTSSTPGSFVTLSTPTGGWTWAKVQALEVKVYISTLAPTDSISVYYVELYVATEPTPVGFYLKQGYQ